MERIEIFEGKVNTITSKWKVITPQNVTLRHLSDFEISDKIRKVVSKYSNGDMPKIEALTRLRMYCREYKIATNKPYKFNGWLDKYFDYEKDMYSWPR